MSIEFDRHVCSFCEKSPPSIRRAHMPGIWCSNPWTASQYIDAALEALEQYSMCILQLWTFCCSLERKSGIDSKHVCTLLTNDLLHWQRTSAGYRTMDLFSAFFNRTKWRTSEQNFRCIKFMGKERKNKIETHVACTFFSCLLGWSLPSFQHYRVLEPNIKCARDALCSRSVAVVELARIQTSIAEHGNRFRVWVRESL